MDGKKAIANGNRGKPSNRRFSDEFRNKMIEIIRDKYEDYEQTIFVPKLKLRSQTDYPQPVCHPVSGEL